ncbi:MAG: hypothetical protein ACJ76Z_05755 [Thermoleophilaceae bacterium]
MRRSIRRLGVSALAAVVVLAAVPAGHATFKGRNGLIAFSGNSRTDLDLFIGKPGAKPHEIRLRSTDERNPAWSPNGKRIALQREPVNGMSGASLWTIGADGRGAKRLATNASNPGWSPDGKKIVFDNFGGVFTSEPTLGIFVIGANGGTPQQIPTEGMDTAEQPDWSPDGKRIAFAAIEHSSNRIRLYVMNADGSGIHRLTDERGADPSWSPDGKRIAFVRQFNTTNSDVFVVNAAGTGERQLTTRTGRDYAPSWSPDGKKILFTRTFNGQGPFAATMTPAGARQVRLFPHSGLMLEDTASWQSLR